MTRVDEHVTGATAHAPLPLLVLAALGTLGAPAGAQQSSDDDALVAYRAYHAATQSAGSLEDLSSFVPAAMVAQIE